MAIKVKELKDDALLSIDVNKSFYLMAKNTLYYLFTQIQSENPEGVEKALETIKAGDYSKMNAVEQAFFTNTLLVSEIERVSIEKNLFDEKEVLEPTDEGYVEPTLG
jgi:hypothetical protein